jgi:hypothetical protein
MKRLAALCLLALASISFTVASASAGVIKPPRQRLRTFICQRALSPAQRSISVEAVMRPVVGTKTMQIRFDLLSRAKPNGGYSAVHGGDLGTWLSPDGQPTLGSRAGDVWTISHPVTGLPAPATYRYRVVFRWLGAKGRVITTRTLLSPKCAQPELRPDLRVLSISIAAVPGKPKQSIYTAVIRNTGATAAGAFQVSFAPGTASGVGVRTRRVARLAAHTGRQVTFLGPACTVASAPTVTADPAGQVDDSNRRNNSLTVPGSCPSLTTPATAP